MYKYIINYGANDMTVDELITAIREDYLSDTFDGWETASAEDKNATFLWKDAALYRYLTEAEKQACMRTDFLFQTGEEESTIALAQDTNGYPISQKLTVIESVVYNNRPVVHVARKNIDLLPYNVTDVSGGDAQTTLFYSIRSRKIYFHPTPSAEDNGKEVILSIYHSPLKPITDSNSTLSIPEEYQRDLIWWVLYEAYSKQDADGYDKKRGLDYLAMFNEKFGLPVPSEVRLNQLQEPQSFHVLPPDYSKDSSIDSDDFVYGVNNGIW